jgi:hypothetical protein
MRVVQVAVTVPEFGGWVCYDHHAHRWLTRDGLQILAATWLEQHGTEYVGRTPNEQSVMESFVHSGDWADWESLQAPQDVGEGLVLKHEVRRIDALLAGEWNGTGNASREKHAYKSA